jgi:hypothetical protein
MEQRTLKNVNDYLNTNINSYLETSVGQSSNMYLNVVQFWMPVLMRPLWGGVKTQRVFPWISVLRKNKKKEMLFRKKNWAWVWALAHY